MMSSTRWSERLERETRRESSKKTKHRVGKKFGTIFSKRSSAAGARFKETSFVQFFLNSDRSFVTFNWYGSFTKKGFYQRYNWNLYQKTMKLSELQNTEDAFIIRPLKHIPYLFSNFQIYLIQSFTHVGFKVLLRQTSFDLIFWMWRMSLLVTNMYFITYHAQWTCFKGNIASTAWKFMYTTHFTLVSPSRSPCETITTKNAFNIINVCEKAQQMSLCIVTTWLEWIVNDWKF